MLIVRLMKVKSKALGKYNPFPNISCSRKEKDKQDSFDIEINNPLRFHLDAYKKKKCSQ